MVVFYAIPAVEAKAVRLSEPDALGKIHAYFKLKQKQHPGRGAKNDSKPAASIGCPFLPPSRLPTHCETFDTYAAIGGSVRPTDVCKHARIFRDPQ